MKASSKLLLVILSATALITASFALTISLTNKKESNVINKSNALYFGSKAQVDASDKQLHDVSISYSTSKSEKKTFRLQDYYDNSKSSKGLTTLTDCFEDKTISQQFVFVDLNYDGFIDKLTGGLGVKEWLSISSDNYINFVIEIKDLNICSSQIQEEIKKDGSGIYLANVPTTNGEKVTISHCNVKTKEIIKYE